MSHETSLKDKSIFGLGGLINELSLVAPKIDGIYNSFKNMGGNDDDDREDVIHGATPQPTQILPPTPNWLGSTKDYVSQVNIPLITIGVGLLGIAVVVKLFGWMRGK